MKKRIINKRLFIAIASLFSVFLIVIVIGVVYEVHIRSKYYGANTDTYRPDYTTITYAPVDFEEDIFLNVEYMEKNRAIKYITGPQSTEYPIEYALQSNDTGLLFFAQYFQSIIHGEYQKHSDFYWDQYFEDKRSFELPTEPFTMQKIHNISVDYRRANTVIESDGSQKTYYIVRYMIFQNNGTFRRDLAENTTVPMLVELTTKGNATRISKMFPYSG